MRYVSAIVLAAGKGLRFKSKIPKPLIKIGAQPIIIRSLNTLSRHPGIQDIIVVANAKNAKIIFNTIRRCRIGKVRNVVLGGRRRQDSVINGLAAINQHTDLVLIHDAVRPFIEQKQVSQLISVAKQSGAAILGVPVKATIKEIAYRKSHIANRTIVKRTLKRESLWEIQTPQVFQKDLILKAYRKYKSMPVTDDASLVEKLGAKVSVVFGSYQNIKITTPEDLILAKAILKSQTSKG